MTRVMGVTEARSRLGEIVDRVRYQGDAVLLEKNGRPAAALIPLGLFEQLRKQDPPATVADAPPHNEAGEMDENELLAVISEAVQAIRAKAEHSTI
jgi:prevent-host-death family protein